LRGAAGCQLGDFGLEGFQFILYFHSARASFGKTLRRIS